MWNASPHALTVEELACRQIGMKTPSGGVSFARKQDMTEKQKARRMILGLLKKDRVPSGLSILTMPGLSWSFEKQLLALREGHWWSRSQGSRSTHITAIESDPAIYRAAMLTMPRKKEAAIVVYPDGPMYACHSTGSDVIRRFHNADFFNYCEQSKYPLNAAWLDFTGYVGAQKMEAIQRFYQERVFGLFVITLMDGRHDKETDLLNFEHGGQRGRLSALFPGKVQHCISYMDEGSVPMVQYAVIKS